MMLVIQVEGEARVALETNRRARCLFKRRYRLESRRPTDAKRWADQLADEACQAMTRYLGREGSSFANQVLMVQLHRNYAYFCFDVFLRDGGEQPSNDMCKKVGQPLYRIIKLQNDVYGLQLNKIAQRIFELQYSAIQQYDKGGLPYFRDMLNPSFYDDGILVEDPGDFLAQFKEVLEILDNQVGDGNVKAVNGRT